MPTWPSTSSSVTARRCACALPSRATSRRSSPSSPTSRVRSRFLRFHGLALAGDRFVRTLVDPDWAEQGRADRRDGRRRRGARSSRSGTTSGCATRTRPRRRSPSPTTSSARGSARGCSSSSHSAPRRTGSRRSSPRCSPRTGPCSPCSRTSASCRRARSTAASSRSGSRSRRPTGYQARVDERDHVAVTASLRPFFEPRTVAVVGASARRGLDRRAHLPQRPRRRVHRRRLSRSTAPASRSPASAPTRSLEEIADPIDLCVDLPPGRARDRRRRGGAAHRDARALRHLGRLRRDGARGRRAPGAAARASSAPTARGSSARTASGSRPPPVGHERDVRAARVPGRADRVLVAVGRARPRAARARRGARARPVGLRLDRQQGRRLLQRPARVVGGRPGHRPRPALPRVVRQPAQVRAHRPAARPREAGARDEERPLARRPEGGRLAHRRARRLGHRRRRRLPPGGRDPRRHALRRCSTSPRCSRASPSRRGAAWPC